jgi:hypothetical protein
VDVLYESALQYVYLWLLTTVIVLYFV